VARGVWAHEPCKARSSSLWKSNSIRDSGRSHAATGALLRDGFGAQASGDLCSFQHVLGDLIERCALDLAARDLNDAP
jgi:hypothetical protein